MGESNENPKGVVRVLIVDDSPTFRAVLRKILNSDPRFLVVGEAENGIEAVRKNRALKPDLITMDILMPKMDGLEATRKIMAEQPSHIVVLSSLVDDPKLNLSFEALRAGALEVVSKPPSLTSPEFQKFRHDFLNQLYALSKVRLIRRRPHLLERAKPAPIISVKERPAEIVALGTSTGGPPAIEHILSHLPHDFPVPIVVVQHIVAGFLESLVSWLANATGFKVRIAKHTERLEPGVVYFAPDSAHLLIRPRGFAFLSDAEPYKGHKPSVDLLFFSIAETYKDRAVGVLLTGMGKDGADGLKAMHDAGAFTIAQDEESAIVYGMPRAAVEAGAARWVLHITDIPDQLIKLCAGAKNNVH